MVNGLGSITSGLNRAAQASSAPAKAGGDFASILAAQRAGLKPPAASAGDVKISAHAEERIRSRAINLTAADRAELARGVDGLRAKGAREALVMLGNAAMIVNVPNRTVVTAMDAAEAESKVFTNIDSALVISGNKGAGPLRGGPGASATPAHQSWKGE